MANHLCFFTVVDGADGEVLTPTGAARSLWSTNQAHGVAVSGAMSRAIIRRAGVERPDLRPARYTLDMFSPVEMAPLRVEVDVAREGRRICLLDARLVQDGATRARASAILLAPSTTPSGQVWQPNEVPAPPPLDLAPVAEGPHIPWFQSAAGWSQDFTAHQNAGRKTTWQHGVPVVEGEDVEPFTAVASIADATTMVCNWGSAGVEYINTDITLSLSRLPRSGEVGLRAERRADHDGIAVGSATVFDRDGVIGTSMVTSLANSRRTVDFGDQDLVEETVTSRV